MSIVTRAVDWWRSAVGLAVFGEFLAAVVVGLGVGLAVPPGSVTVSVVGALASVAVGGVLVAAEAIAYLRIPDAESGCGCEG